MNNILWKQDNSSHKQTAAPTPIIRLYASWKCKTGPGWQGGRATFSSSIRLLYSSPAFHFRQCECWELWGGAISSVADTRTAELPHRYSNPPLPPHANSRLIQRWMENADGTQYYIICRYIPCCKAITPEDKMCSKRKRIQNADIPSCKDNVVTHLERGVNCACKHIWTPGYG